MTTLVSRGKLMSCTELAVSNNQALTGRAQRGDVMSMPLSFSPVGSVASVKAIKGKDETRRFLESLGFVVGGNVTVVSANGGNLIVNVKESRIALSQAMANRIIV